MAEINVTREQERVQQRENAAVTAYRAMLDTFVNIPERQIASGAEQVRPRQSQGAQPQSKKAL
jgi:hypothetical protein